MGIQVVLCEFTHSCDEAVKRLPPLCVLDCDRTEVVSEPDCWNNSACVAISNIFLCVGGVGEGEGKKRDHYK